jgi:ABC-type transport system involved in cytochrome bd biosynthesis fused ATPase/permease subunit
MAFSAIADAASATQRLYAVFEAETLEETLITEPDLPNAIEVQGAAFTWDSPPPATQKKKKQKGPTQDAAKTAEAEKAARQSKADEENIFKMSDINLSIPRGLLVAIVGPVGTGKSSLLQGIVGEMRKTAGTIKFGGSVAYCPQMAWIQVNIIPAFDSFCCC